MTLSLDDVRNTTFHVVSSSDNRMLGYQMKQVDEFMDRVETLVSDLVESRAHLESQVEALQAGSAGEQPTAEAASTEQRLVVTTGKEASSAVVRLVEMATEQAERLVAEAEADASRIREEASRDAERVTSEANERAHHLQSEAQESSDRMRTEASERAAEMDADTERRRGEMQSALEQERDALMGAIEQLRAYESAYRGNLADHLRQQLQAVEAGRFEPIDMTIPVIDKPAAGDAGPGSAEVEDAVERQPESETPRLDALLGEQH